jgi:hypothetical protein
MYNKFHTKQGRCFCKTVALVLALCAVILFSPLTAYAEDGGETDGDVEAVTETYEGAVYYYNNGYGNYADNDYYIGIEAVTGAFDFSDILSSILDGYTGLDTGLFGFDMFGLTLPHDGSAGFLTPDGTGTILDNVLMGGSALEFFTFTTDAGNVFFLIIDRTRESDNVFFLNAVTEWSLMALAEAADIPGGDYTVSAIPDPPGGNLTDPDVPYPEDEYEDTNGSQAAAGGGVGGTAIFILIGAIVFGGVAYYLKILRPRQMAADDEDYDDPDDYDDGDDDYLSLGGADIEDSEDGFGYELAKEDDERQDGES